MKLIGLSELTFNTYKGVKHNVKFKNRKYNFNEEAVGENSIKRVVIYGDCGSGKTTIIDNLFGKSDELGDIQMVFDTSEGVVKFSNIYDKFLQMNSVHIDEFNGVLCEDLENYDDVCNDVENLCSKIKRYKPNRNVFLSYDCVKRHCGEMFDFTDLELTYTSLGDLVNTIAFIYKCKEDNASLILIDDFCNTLSDNYADVVMDILNSVDIPYVISTNKTCLMNNDILRPDCYYVVNKKSGLNCICDLTDKELREGHNLEKFYKGGVFS